MSDIEQCRTSALGAHRRQCDHCGYNAIAYNSCRNRHCPKCQASAQAEWVEKQHDNLLPVTYFHLVFTLPQELAPLALQNQRIIYDLVFHCAWDSLRILASDPRYLAAEVGMTAVLHTWGQTLTHHPHLHCIVPGGGLAPDSSRWIASSQNFFLPVKPLSRLFRRLFLTALGRAFQQGHLSFHGQLSHLNDQSQFSALLDSLRRKNWVVYAKRPFGGPQQVINYLGRYTHRIAISNYRLIKLENGQVTFKWRDYRDRNREKLITLDADEFIRRFLLHVLPDGFVRIRHYGLLSTRQRKTKLALCRQLLIAEAWKLTAPASIFLRKSAKLFRRCPHCQQGLMQTVEIITSEQLARSIASVSAQPP
jgi:Putative transposase/Transposase zinc-binding domain